jgi:hypothetical protein
VKDDDLVARLESADMAADFLDDAGGIRTEDMRHGYPVRRHFALHDPDIKVIHGECLDADEHLMITMLRHRKIPKLYSFMPPEFGIKQCFHCGLLDGTSAVSFFSTTVSSKDKLVKAGVKPKSGCTGPWRD